MLVHCQQPNLQSQQAEHEHSAAQQQAAQRYRTSNFAEGDERPPVLPLPVHHAVALMNAKELRG
jgi:hypothetical protein